MNQSRRLKRLARPFLRHFVGRQLSQFLINQRQQLLSRLPIPFFNPLKDLRDITHKRACREITLGQIITQWFKTRLTGTDLEAEFGGLRDLSAPKCSEGCLCAERSAYLPRPVWRAWVIVRAHSIPGRAFCYAE